jgi:phosphohistidine phosphatase
VTSGKILFIIRHGKAEIHAETDYKRKLKQRAYSDLQCTSSDLLNYNKPDLIVCSPAYRTRETLECIQNIHGHTYTHVKYSESLYLADLNQLLNTLSHIPEPFKTVWIIGHNPGLLALCQLLLTPLAFNQLPTSAIAGISWNTNSWSTALQTQGTLRYWKTPK